MAVDRQLWLVCGAVRYGTSRLAFRGGHQNLNASLASNFATFCKLKYYSSLKLVQVRVLLLLLLTTTLTSTVCRTLLILVSTNLMFLVLTATIY
jgi:hypothetical protein